MDYRVNDLDGQRVYALEGRFTHADNDKFSAILSDIQRGPGRRLRIDLSGLDYLDSYGIGLFLVARDEARHAANLLEFGEPRGAVRKMFDLAGLTSLLAPERSPDRRRTDPLPAGPNAHRFRMSDVHTDDAGTCHIALAGRFTFADHEGFQRVIDAIGHVRGKRWRIDLSELEFMDSAALSMLLIVRDQARENGVEIVLVNPTGRVRQLFALADLPLMMTVEEGGRT